MAVFVQSPVSCVYSGSVCKVASQLFVQWPVRGTWLLRLSSWEVREAPNHPDISGTETVQCTVYTVVQGVFFLAPPQAHYKFLYLENFRGGQFLYRAWDLVKFRGGQKKKHPVVK